MPPFLAKNMTKTDVAAPLAAALAAKGYASLTSVQEAVTAPELHGRDILVSAQTGSGKTVAFGLAMADELMEDDKLPPAELPLALAIAPTRELALQVARELQWLYAEAGVQIATCVGGMDYRTERRNLARGAHIVVGTPGRLRDHIERGGLDLGALRVAVLDEADEMLDLGFREDLEFILQSAPESRRTMMFSATVPPEIEKLAKDFQRDALRIVAGGEARQHGDITYRAMSVTLRDRENAIFNTLRFYEARTAIVFCKTRANVSHLLARMGNRGFKVVALSGELSQQERTHALQALRDGRANVCIATDVAARGIDLPGLDLVIHADLPTNSETLLHRSGRTGRAGAKGVSALIVPAPEYKKAQRLLSQAKVSAEWGKAPSAEDVQARDDQRMLETTALNNDVPEDIAPIAQDLLQRFGAERLAAAFVQMWREGRPPPEEITGDAPVMQAAATRERGPFGPSVWFSLTVGHSGRAEARWLLPKICEGGNITRDSIGAIRVKTDVTFVQIAADVANQFGDGMELEPGLYMNRLAGEPSFDRPERPERAPRSFAPRDDSPRSDGPRKPSFRKEGGYRDAPKEGFKDTKRRPRFDPLQGDADIPAAKPEGKQKARWTKADRDQKAGDKPRKSDGPAPRSAKPAFGEKPRAKFGRPAAPSKGRGKPKGR